MTTITKTVLNNKMKELVAKQRDYFRTGATLSLEFRLEQLEKLKSVLEDNVQALHNAINADFGRSRYENEVLEIMPLMEEIDLALKNLHKWMKPRRVRTNPSNMPARSYIIPEPLGVSLVIGAWNLPYNLTLTPLVGSIMAGNTTIVKPSELPVQTSKIMTKLINENFDPKYIHAIEGEIPETTALLSQHFDKIFFTGSPMVGKIVNKAAAENLTNVTLELGGKNPVLFTEDANFEIGVKRLIWAKFVNAGQFCITADYVLVPKSKKTDFLKLAKAEIEKSNFSLENNNYVQIINERNFDRVASMIDKKKVYCGGEINRDHRMIEPTIMHNVTPKDAVMQDEIFGPILPVLTYDSIEEAYDIIRSIPKPLAAYIYTQDRAKKERFIREVPAGSMSVNDTVMQISNVNLPFGGVGNSGQGRYHAEQSFACFSNYKSVLDKPTWFEPDFKYYGYTEKKMKTIRRVF